MCRLTAVLCSESQALLLADILTRPRMSIIRQSYQCKERFHFANPRWVYEVSTLNGDGFGVGWYLPRRCRQHRSIEKGECPCVFTSLKPAWSDRNLVNIAENTMSHLIFAHVRAAGPGAGWSSEMNCHPFQYGRFLFMHNGSLGDWLRIRGRCLSLLTPPALDFVLSAGALDSVLIFGLIISQLDRGPLGDYNPNELRLVLERALAVLDEVLTEECVSEPSWINCVFTDGNCVLAVRHAVAPAGEKAHELGQASLYFATGTRWARSPNSADMYQMVHTDKRNEVAIITSEPLTDCKEDWVPVPRSHILIVTAGVDVLIYRVPKKAKTLSHMLMLPTGLRKTRRAVKPADIANLSVWLPPLRCFKNMCESCSGGSLNSPMIPSLFFTHLPLYIGHTKENYGIQRTMSQAVEIVNHQATEDPTPPPTTTLKTTTIPYVQSIAQSLTVLSQPDTPISFSLPPLRAPSELISQDVQAPRKTTDESAAGDDSIEEFFWEKVLSFENSPPKAFRERGRSYEGSSPCSGLLEIPDIPCRHIVAGSKQCAVLCMACFTVARSSLDTHVSLHSKDDGCVAYRFEKEDPACYAVTGSQDGLLSVWSLDDGICHATLQATQGAVLCLTLTAIERSEDSDAGTMKRLLLFVGSSDTTLSIWDLSGLVESTVTTEPHVAVTLLLRISFLPAQGDILSLVLHEENDGPIILAGFQTTSIGFFYVHDLLKVTQQKKQGSVHHRVMFPNAHMDCSTDPCGQESLVCGDSPEIIFHLFPCKDNSRHCGFIESLISYGDLICSGGGDGLILVWKEKKCLATLVGHRGGVLCLAASELETKTLYSGSRDKSIRIWDLETLSCKQTLKGHMSDILSLAVSESTLFSGSASGELFGWCRRTHQLVMQFDAAHSMSMTTLSLLPTTSSALLEIATRSANSPLFRRPLTRTDPEGQQRGQNDWSSEVTGVRLIASGGDGCVRSWRIRPRKLLARPSVDTLALRDSADFFHGRQLGNDLENILRAFVAIPSVSGRPAYQEECWRAARFLSNCFKLVGADAQLVDAGAGRNPLVVARLGFDSAQPTVLFYSHYDVVPAGPQDDELLRHPVLDTVTSPFRSRRRVRPPHWKTSPWELTLIDGFFYGRGVTDNKGPLLGQIFAVLGLQKLSTDPLPFNIVWVSEGEEENGSSGFEETIRRLRAKTKLLQGVSCIVCNNSYWVNDTLPCLVSGMRGVIDCTLTVQGSAEAVGHHSGFHGGALAEPMLDLLTLLGKLILPNGHVQIPGFYDDVDPTLQALDDALLQDPELHDLEFYKKQTNHAGLRDPRPAQVYRTRWLEPVMSVTEIWSSTQEGQSGADLGQTFRVIPSRIHCNISIRTVPRQDRHKLIDQLTAFVKSTFDAMKSPNRLSVHIANSSDWWVGDTDSAVFRAASSAVEKVWGKQPLVVREGGTMPVIRFLQDTFQVPAVHIPIGQASDAAHLPNERLRAVNLQRGIDMLQYFLLHLRDV